MVFKAENLDGVFSKLDEFLDEWDVGASIELNAPGGELLVDTLEILSPEGDVLYWLKIQNATIFGDCYIEWVKGFQNQF